MKKLFPVILGAAVILPLAHTGAQWNKTSGRTVYLEDESVRTCNQINMFWDNRHVARGEQEYTVARSSTPLRIRAAHNGGVHVYGGDGSEFRIKACAAAASRDYSAADRALDRIKVNIEGSQVSVSGPGTESDWSVFLIVSAPRDSSIVAESYNGPIGIRNFAGTVEARSHNGPVSLSSVTGRVRAETRNGPISVGGDSSGDFDLDLQNGPLDVHLRGTRWEGKLDGRTQNGPVTLSVPADYRSAVRVDASEHSPVSCRAPQCRTAVRTWEHPSRIQFGGDSPVVRLSTVNGPVTVR